MNALTLLIAAMCVFALAYRLYGKFIAAKILVLDDARQTPAYALQDGRDYDPTNKYVLFGHHFAAIAGAGPLIGPVLAAQFGYLPGYLWILIGAVLAGAVHDIVILFASVRMNGLSLTVLAKEHVSRPAGIACAFAALFIIITALAGLAIAVVNALNESAWATFTIIMTMPAALVVALWMYKLRPGKIFEASLIGVAIVLLGVGLGEPISRSSFASWFLYSKPTLSVALPVYGFIASVLPVWLLLCPRDYLSSYMKIGTVLFLVVGIVVVHPSIHMPAVTQFVHGGGPIIPGKVWPFVCITIACGAISGFHALVGSGTTPKMIRRESDILMMGYGAMVLESVVSVMALIAATVLLPNDYFAINLSPEKLKSLGLAAVNLPGLEQMVSERLTDRAGGAVTLATGMAYILSSIPGMKAMMSYWYHFAIMFEALFILTTVDAGTRVARYILQELIKPVHPRLGSSTWWPAVLLTSGIVSFAWGYLIYRGDISTIWPMFGVANQLLATVALSIGTVFILHHTRSWKYGLVTFIPSLFMLVTTGTAGVLNIVTRYIPRHEVLNGALTVIMLALVLIVYVECLRKVYNLRGMLFPAKNIRQD